MLSRLSVLAALTACLVTFAPALRAETAASRRVVYQVADLVAPITGGGKAEKTEKAQPTREAWLIEYLINTVEPSSWAAHGGTGTVDYFPMGGCLVVNRTPAIQQRVGALLTDLRKQQDTQVALEVRILTVTEEVFERIGVDFNLVVESNQLPKLAFPAAMPLSFCPAMLSTAEKQGAEAKFLTDIQLRLLLEAAAGDQNTSISQFPRMTLFSGQEVNINVVEDNVASTLLTALPRVSADRRFVQVRLKLDQTEVSPANKASSRCIATTTTIPDGGTVVLGGFPKENVVPCESCPPLISRIPYLNRLFKTTGCVRQNQLEFVLVTPRIVSADDKAEQQPSTTTEAMPQPLVMLPCPVTDVEGKCLTLPSAHYIDHFPQYTPPSPPCPPCCDLAVQQTSARELAPDHEATALKELLKAYDQACAEGKTAAAKKLAKAALILDPTCFSKQR